MRVVGELLGLADDQPRPFEGDAKDPADGGIGLPGLAQGKRLRALLGGAGFALEAALGGRRRRLGDRFSHPQYISQISRPVVLIVKALIFRLSFQRSSAATHPGVVGIARPQRRQISSTALGLMVMLITPSAWPTTAQPERRRTECPVAFSPNRSHTAATVNAMQRFLKNLSFGSGPAGGDTRPAPRTRSMAKPE